MGQWARTGAARAGGRVGFGLGGALGQQAQRFFDCVGQRFFEVAQVLFRGLVNSWQARRIIGLPGLEFSLGELALD